MLRKYATLQLLESWQIPVQSGPDGITKAAHRVAFDYLPRKGYLYVRSRMISSRTNDNHDTFPAAEIEAGYKTFLGKPVFVNHHNANHRRARGVIVAVALHRDKNRDGSPDTWVEGLMEIDAVRFPKLAKAVIAGRVNRTSMGVDVEWSKCSACGNKATSPAEYCSHLPAMKGKKIRKTNPVTGKVEERLIHEICAGLSFFENSLLVEDPADPTAVILDKPDGRGLNMSPRSASTDRSDGRVTHTEADGYVLQSELPSSRVSSAGRYQGQKFVFDDPSVGRGEFDSRVAYARQAAAFGNHVGGVDGIGAQEPVQRVHADLEVARVADHQSRRNRSAQQLPSVPVRPNTRTSGVRQGEARVPAVEGSARPRVTEPRAGRQVNRSEVARNLGFGTNKASVQRAPADHGVNTTGDVDARGLDRTASRNAAGDEYVSGYADDPRFDGVSLRRDSKGYYVATHRARSSSYESPEKIPASKIEFIRSTGGKKIPGGEHPFFKANPVSSGNIVRAYHETTDDEKALGDRWYADAHHVAKAIAGGDAAKGAGLLSAYSPRTAWPINMFNASRAAQGDPPGPGSGAMGMHQAPAMRILAGEHHSTVLTAPKTAAFARLIEHGGDTPEEEASGRHNVVIDRHAMSVAMGRRISDDDDAPIDKPQHYEHVAKAYRVAAHILSQHYGRKISPHQVQAATWLAQIRKNNEADKGLTGPAANTAKGRATRTEKAKTTWHHHHKEHHPGGIPEENMHHRGKRVVAYGETRVPPQVDTLRMEECPVCGEHDVWSGDRCPVCGFVVPPSLFRDPDTSKAQQVRDQLDEAGEVTTGPDGMAQTAPGTGPDGQIGSGDDADDQLIHPDQITPNGVPTVRGGDSADGQPPEENEEDEEPVPGEMPHDGAEPEDDGAGPEDPRAAGQEEQAEGEELQAQGEEEQAQGEQDQAEGQELEQQGEEDALAPDDPGPGEDPGPQETDDLECPACGMTYTTDGAAQPGVPCPSCKMAALVPIDGADAGMPGEPGEDEEDEEGDVPGGPRKEQEDPSESAEDEGEEKMAGSSKTAAALAQAQARRIAELTAERDVLDAQLSFLARAAGVDRELAQIRTQVMRRHADVLNPASPVPDPPEAPPSQTTEQALQSGSYAPAGHSGTPPRGTGHTVDDPSRPGATPGSMVNVPAAQTTTSITPGVEMQTPPATNLTDVTAPVQGTNPSQDGGVPLEQRRIETDVRIDPDPLKAHGPGIGGAGDNGAAFPWLLDARQPQQKAASARPAAGEDDAARRTFASIRLAKLHITAGLAQGEELAVAERIEKDASLSLPMIEREIAVLTRTTPATGTVSGRPMQRQAARQAPSLASVGAMAQYAPAAGYGADDLDGSDIFL